MNIQQAVTSSGRHAALAVPAKGSDIASTVLNVLRGIRPLQSNGLPYGMEINLADAGFTSIEMVKVMLAVEAAFDLMIPQDHITPEHFATPAAIAAMIDMVITAS